MGLKKNNMWTVIKLWSAIVASLATIVGAIAIYKEKQQGRGSQVVRDNKTEQFRTDQKETAERNEDEIIQEIKTLGLSKNALEALKLFLGENYEETINDPEAFKELRLQYNNGNALDIFKENEKLRSDLENSNAINNDNTKRTISELISRFKYESARIVINNYINDNPNLKPEFLAELYIFMASTFAQPIYNHTKRKEYLDKAMEHNPNNPEVLRHTGKYLNYTGKNEESIKLLKKALKQSKNGAELEPYSLTSLMITLGNAHIQLEMKKVNENRDFTLARGFLEKAKVANSQLSAERNQLYKIYKDIAQIEIVNGGYDEAADLLKKSIDIEKGILGDRASVHTGFSFLALGTCYASKLNFSKGNYKGKEKDYKSGEIAFQNALTIFNATVGDKHIYVANTLNNFGNLEKVVNNIPKAIEYYLEAIEILNAYELHSPLELANSYTNLARSYAKISMKKDALANAELALPLFREKLPEGHMEIVILKQLIDALRAE